MIPWDDLANHYATHLQTDCGRNSINLRCVIGSVIIKHKEKLSDRATVGHISENMYMQYFCGLNSFTTTPPFDASLFVTICKRLGKVVFDKFHESIVEAYDQVRHAYPEPKDKNKKMEERELINEDKEKKEPKEALEELKQVMAKRKKTSKSGENVKPSHGGKLKIDATIADQYIKYPTDLNLLNESRENLERMIDALYVQLGWTKKPRTYRRKARQAYLAVSKKKVKSKKVWRQAIRQQVQYVHRDIKLYTKC